MDILKKIETLVPKAMGSDQHTIYRALSAIKKKLRPTSKLPENNTKACQQLLKRVQDSVFKRQVRQKGRPISLNFDPDLPIIQKKTEIIEAIKKNCVVIISGETGSGKTTQIPKFCLEAEIGRAHV